MFKKSGAIVLTMLYLVTAMGFAINLRYCGKIITAVKINTPVKNCNNNLVSSKMKCCSQKHVDLKIKDSHIGGFPSFLGKLFSYQVAGLPFARNVFNIPVTASSTTIGRAPPDQPLADNIPVFIKNCTFRI